MANAKPKVGKISPPPMQRGGRKSLVDSAILDEFKASLPEGEHVSDNIEYEDRDKASAQVMRIKKALVNDPDTRYEENKDLKSRVWNCTDHSDDSKDSRFMFALIERESS